MYVPNEKRLGDPILEAQHNDSALYKQNVKNGGNDVYVRMIGFPYSNDIEKAPGVPDDAVPDPPAVISFKSVNPEEEIRMYNEAVKSGFERFVMAKPAAPDQAELHDTPAADPVVVDKVVQPVIVRTVLKFSGDDVDKKTDPVPVDPPRKRPSTFRFTDGNIRPVFTSCNNEPDKSESAQSEPSKLNFTSGMPAQQKRKPIKRIVFK